MLSITIEEIIPIWLANQLSRPDRAKIDLAFEKTAKKIGRGFAQWRAEFNDDQAERAEQRLPFADRVRLSAERAARRGPKKDRIDVLIDCLLVAWFPVHEALCGLGNSEYGRHDIRTLSRQALEQIALILDRTYDRDLHLGRNVPLAETWRKPHLVDPASGTLTAGAMAKVERHRLWIKGQKMWRAIAERAAQPPSESLGPPSDWSEFLQRLLDQGITLRDLRRASRLHMGTLGKIQAGRPFNRKLLLPKLVKAAITARAENKLPLITPNDLPDDPEKPTLLRLLKP